MKSPPRLLLLSSDDLRVIWDALMRHRLALDVGDPELDDAKRLVERVGDLLADNIWKGEQ